MKNNFSIGIILLFCFSCFAQDWSKIHPTGVRPLTAEEEARIRPKMFQIKEPQGLFKAPLPSSVKNTTYLPVVNSQGGLGSCAAFATCYYMKTYQEAKEHGWIRPDPTVNPERIASPAWGYNIAVRMPAYGDLAVNHYQVAEIICDYGIANLQEMPYDGNPQTYQWDAWPSEEVWRRAIEWRSQAFGSIYIHSQQGIDTLKEHLASGNVAVITTHVYSNFDQYPFGAYTDNEVLYHYTTTGYRGGHALTVVGYDDNKQYYDTIDGKTKKGAFLCVNSWGQDWGVIEPTVGTAGFIWLPYDFFLQKKNGDPEALVIIDRINYKPEITATIGINHTRGRKLIVRIYGAEKHYPTYPPDEVRWMREGMPVSNDYPLENSRIVVDLTDFAHYGTMAWYLEVMQLQMYPGTGQVNYFAVQKGDGTPVESIDVPKSTVSNWFIWCKTGLFQNAGDLFGGLKVRRGGISWTDFNKDGKPDLLISGYDWKTGSAVPSTLLFINNGNGTFQSGITGNLPQLGNSILACADYDNDGYIDVAISNYNPQTQNYFSGLYHNNGNNTFSSIPVTLPQEIYQLSWVDYDNDGKYDLAVKTEEQLILYKNSGGNNFSTYAQPIDVTGTISWADYDGDGWTDFVVSGRYKTAIYRNAGDGIFVEQNSNFPALRQASVAWSDYDNDGDLDLALSGRKEDNTAFTGIFRNNGDGTFSKIETQITSVFAGSIVFADINNDGYPDLIITGRTEDEFSTRYLENYPNRSTIYLNDGCGCFINATAELPGVSVADFLNAPAYTNTLAVLDYDGDGDLDVFLSGTNTYVYTTTPSHIITGIWKNLFADPFWSDKPNTRPLPPNSLFTTPGLEDGSIVLNWNSGSDDETPDQGLYYNVRVGSSSGGSDIVNPVNRLIMPGSIPLKERKLLLSNLPPGTYYWAVQTVDSGLAVSQWSQESSFIIPSYTRKYNLYISSSQPNYGTTNPAPGVHAYNNGTNVQITAIPFGGYTFSHWSTDIDTQLQNPASILMDRPRIITANFKLLHDISPQWQQVLTNIPWGQTQWHSTVIFNNRIWAIGGYNGPYRSNAVYWSTDGANWTTATPEAAWTKRTGHVSLVFNNKIWVLGGSDATGYLNDVWSSSDGINWTQHTSSAPWQKRYGFAGLVYNGKIWIFGGKGVSGWLNDVWYSTDGTNWTRATASAQWRPREGLAAVVFNNKMWVIGGYQGPVDYASDVWYSTDGTNWTCANQSAAWSPRYYHSAFVHDSRIWITGGIAMDSQGNWISVTNQLWYSWDGVYWSCFENSPWQARYGHTSFSFNNKIWVLGGNDIWSATVPGRPSGTLMLTIATNNNEAGTTTPSPGYYYDTSGKIFHLKAIANYGYQFTGWTGDVADPNAAETTTTLNADKVVVANFAKKTQYQLTVAVSPAGSGSTIPSTGTNSYPEGTAVDIFAIPSQGYVFSHWTGDVGDPQSDFTTVLMDGNKTITANFIPDPFSPAIGIDGGENHSVFLQNEGTVWTWGANNYGQLGNGTQTDLFEPTASTVIDSVKAVSAGSSHTAALKTNGTVWTWGANNYGQLGINLSQQVVSVSTPSQVSNLTTITAISCGAYHTLALKNDGTVWAWGRNDSYQLGLGPSNTTDRIIPSQVIGPQALGYLTEVKRIAAGYNHSLAIRNDGTVWAWGDNSFGQLGTGNKTVGMYPVKVKNLSDIKGISAGGAGVLGSHSLAVRSDGSVWTWGANDKGQLGDGTNIERIEPVQVKGPTGTGFLSDIRQVAAGGRHSLALDKDGNVWAWGDNTSGQLGNGTNDDSNYPVAVIGLPEIKSVAAGLNHSLAIDKDGNVWVWGYNGSGQFGNGSQESSNIPVMLNSVASGNISHTLTVSVSPAGSGSTIPSGAKKYRNNVYATITAIPGPRYQFSHWSGDASGTDTQIQLLMDGNKNIVANFVLMPGVKCKLTMLCNPAGAGYLVPDEGQHEFDVGTVVNLLVVPGYRYNFIGWSNNVKNPQARETSITLNGDTTVTAYFTKQDFSAYPDISAGGQHNLVLRSDSTVIANGLNNYGQLGINSNTNNAGKVQVKDVAGTGPLSGIIQVAAGSYHSTALGYDGTVYSWGLNAYGQLGDGTNTNRLRPVKVKSPDGAGELSGITYISAGSSHTAAIKMDKTLWAWGANNYGQLGNNLTTNSNLPVQVHGEMNRGFLTNVKSVACGPEHTLALLEDGTVWAWGRNHQGQLGNGTTQDSHVPVKVSNLTDVVAIAASDYPPAPPFSLALKSNGTVWAWGGGRDGQLGNGQSGNDYYSSVPVQVSGLTNIIAIAAGDNHALALRSDGTVWAWGANSMGQLGDGTTDNIRTTPVQVKGQDGTGYLTGIIKISAGYSYCMALKQDGTVWFWGLQQFDIFGGIPWTLLKYPTPVPVSFGQMDTSVQLVYLKMLVFPGGAGTTSPIESIHAYNPGSVVNLRAMPNPGYVFSHWSQADNIFLSDSSITMDATKTVIAYFEKILPEKGDINKDGVIDIQDTILALRMSIELPITIGAQTKRTPYLDEILIADVNSDGEISIADAILILRLALGLGTQLPDPYGTRTVVGPETTPETQSVNVSADQSGQISLSDKTEVSIPAISSGYSLTLQRITNYIDIEKELNLDPDEGLSPQTSGSLRTLQIDLDSTLTDTDKLSMVPVITIPKQEIGVLNPDTVNILRISETVVNGQVVRNVSLLPVHFDKNGNLVTKDIYLSGELITGKLPIATKKGNAPIYISYIPLTFQGTINWVREPKFVRMVPDGKSDARRKPIDKLSDEEREWELKKPIKNVIVLVHGHNEAEKTGLPGQFERNADFPWAVDYKRDVWKYLYEVFLKDYKEFNSCTVFYEFIYPTWRPIFGHLDDMLVEKITSELEKQLSYNVEEKDSFAFNLFIVAHSMGGVVSRAAIVKFPEVLDDQFKHFISWGSPHRGAAMYSLRYLLTSPAYSARTWKGSALSSAMGAYVGATVIDAPGIMDLRWTNGAPGNRRFLKFDEYFQVDSSYVSEIHKYDLRNGTLLYNQRLQQLNDVDNRGSKYTLLYGITSQGMPLEFIEEMDVIDLVDVLASGEIAIGATINRFLIENGSNILHSRLESDSDGAVPIVSMTGLGLNPSLLVDVGDIDHEAYYHVKDDAILVANTTLEKLGFKTNPLYDPPEIIFTSPSDNEILVSGEGGEITIEGRVDWKGPRKLDGNAVKAVKVFRYTYAYEFEHGFDWQGQEVTVEKPNWTINSNGEFSITCNVSQPEQIYALRVVIVFRDDTEMHGVVMLGCPDQYTTTAQGETITWSVQGLGKVFPIDNETYVYERPNETTAVAISAQVNPVYREDNAIYNLFSGKYTSSGGDPVESQEDEITWYIGLQQPPELNQMEIDFSTNYENNNLYVIAYTVIDLGEGGELVPAPGGGFYWSQGVAHIVRQVFAFLFPTIKHEKEQLLPPYFRPEQVPDEE